MEGLSIVLAVRWDSELVEHWLQMYERYTKLDNELIIVADQPTWQMLKLLQKRCLKYYLTENSNMYENWNYASQFSTKEFICFTQPDHHLSPEWDYRLREATSENNYLGIKEWGIFDTDSNRATNTHFCNKEEDILSFNFGKWEEWCKSNIVNEVEEGAGNEICLHIGTFKELHGFGYSPYSVPGGHIHHEDGLKWRIKNKKGGNILRIKSATSFHFKFGAAKDMETHTPLYNSQNPDWGRKYNVWQDLHKGNLWKGNVKCMKCGLEKDPTKDFGGWPEGFNNIDIKKSINRGYWLCSDCRTNDPEFDSVQI